MKFNNTITSSVYVFYHNKVLLHRYKKYNILFPLGGKMSEEEVPHQTAIREVYEESVLQVELYNRDSELDLGRVLKLHSPMHTLLENVGYEVENIYFATVFFNEVRLQKGEDKELYCFTKEEIKSNDTIKPHVKSNGIRCITYFK